MSLPSYEEATAELDPWTIIAPKLPNNLWMILCLVSKHFYEIFVDLLWFDPARVILRNPSPLGAYERFIRIGSKARAAVRSHVNILDFSPLAGINLSEYQKDDIILSRLQVLGDPYSRWLDFWRAYFPSLKFIIADGLTEFHIKAMIPHEILEGNALPTQTYQLGEREKSDLNVGGRELSQFIHSGNSSRRPLDIAEGVQISVRPILISVAECAQLGMVILSNQDYTRKLLYLDLSWAKIGSLDLPKLAGLQHLKILKLQGLRLKTQQLSPILEKLRVRLFSLDLRGNHLTDDLIPVLLKWNLRPSLVRHAGLDGGNRGDDGTHDWRQSSSSQLAVLGNYLDDAPAYRERGDVTEEQETTVADGRVDIRADDLRGVLTHLLRKDQLKSIQTPYGLPLDVESFMQPTGLTHIHLSNNQFSSDALKILLQGTNRLQLLDFGSVPQSHHNLAAKNPNVRPICQPDTVKLLQPSVSPYMESLRIHHSVVTHTPTLGTIGEFHLSEVRRVCLSEGDYALEEMRLWPTELSPDINPRIKTLTLTHVPHKSSGLVISRLLNFIHQAAIQESSIAKAAPVDTRRGARMLSGIRLLRLEFEPASKSPQRSTTGPSVSDQPDADTFMVESSKDFSFFDEGGDYQESAAKDFSFFDDERPPVRSPSTSFPSGGKKGNPDGSKLRDVMEEIRAYRVRTKGAYEAEAEKLGSTGLRVPLGAPHYHWTGRLELIP